ncbi:mshD [Acrasis kona]|uniref:MshD n=1 Tax=Acrasis kona TaxID=1008807 RepID=A0AAW2YXK1_9EUKA
MTQEQLQIEHDDIQHKLQAHIDNKQKELICKIKVTMDSKYADEIAAVMNDAYKDDWTGPQSFKTCDRTNKEDIINMMRSQPNNGAFVLLMDGHERIQSLFFVDFNNVNSQRVMGLHMLSVPKKLQGRGLGSLLMTLSDITAETCSCSSIELTVISQANLIKDMYSRKGFVEYGTKPWPESYISHIQDEKRSEIYFYMMRKTIKNS